MNAINSQALNLEAKVEEGHVLTEYDQIPRTRAEFELEHLASRDRIKEVVPYSDCRVEVSPSIDNPCGYINASHVKVRVFNISKSQNITQTDKYSEMRKRDCI